MARRTLVVDCGACLPLLGNCHFGIGVSFKQQTTITRTTRTLPRWLALLSWEEELSSQSGPDLVEGLAEDLSVWCRLLRESERPRGLHPVQNETARSNLHQGSLELGVSAIVPRIFFKAAAGGGIFSKGRWGERVPLGCGRPCDQRQAPAVQVERERGAQIQFIFTVLDIPVATQGHLPTVQNVLTQVQNIVFCRSCSSCAVVGDSRDPRVAAHFLDLVVDMPVVFNDRCLASECRKLRRSRSCSTSDGWSVSLLAPFIDGCERPCDQAATVIQCQCPRFSSSPESVDSPVVQQTGTRLHAVGIVAAVKGFSAVLTPFFALLRLSGSCRDDVKAKLPDLGTEQIPPRRGEGQSKALVCLTLTMTERKTPCEPRRGWRRLRRTR